MHDKILTYVNVGLVLICAGCIVFLSLARYSKPEEIVNMEAAARRLERGKTSPSTAPPNETALSAPGETSFGGAVESNPGPVPSSAKHVNLTAKKPYFPFYTPTPTPTPTPVPTPVPPPIAQLIQYWKINTLNADSVDITNRETETFTMKIGGPPHMSKWADGLLYPVKLDSIDMDNFRAIFSFNGTTHPVALQ